MLQALLLAIAGYDIYLSVSGLFFRSGAVAHAANFFNFNLELTTSTYWLIGLLSTYLLAFAAFLILAATNPVKYLSVIYICLGIFFVRIFQRIHFILSDSATNLVADPSKTGFYLGSIVVAAVALLFLTFKIRKQV